MNSAPLIYHLLRLDAKVDVRRLPTKPPELERAYRRYESRRCTYGSYRVEVAAGHDEETDEFRVVLRRRNCGGRGARAFG
jgi:hypothetical protein